MTRFSLERDRIERWFRDALKVVEPRGAVHRSLAWDGQYLSFGDSIEVPEDGRLVVIAIGKAAAAMARGARDVLGDRIDAGIVLTKDGHGGAPVEGFTCYEAGHPVPDERGVRATRDILRLVAPLTVNDRVLALISGGGSALLEAPRDPATLDDIRVTTNLLMHAGAGIHDLNAVRRRLSDVKGGGLLAKMGEATCVSLLLSDVLGNDPHVIASGPTVPPPLDARDAWDVVRKFEVDDRIPATVRDILSSAPTGPQPFNRHYWEVIADNAALVREFERLVTQDGVASRVAWERYDGDARDLGHRMVGDALATPAGVDVLIGGGEATANVRGDGKGGRNTEAALVAAMRLAESNGEWVIASLASDGDDGSARAAGAIADRDTVARGIAAGIDAREALARSDSASFFRHAGGLIETGPTGTNVNDVYIALRVKGDAHA